VRRIERIVVGTRNPGKLAELQALLQDLYIEVVGLAAFPDAPDVVEDGATFEANATKKAVVLAEAIGEWVVADDSGLVVDALDGRPGVYSARYAGEHGDDAANVAKLLAELGSVPDAQRAAHFECAIALASPAGVELVAEGRCEGVIAREPAGENGFGYDPVFFYPPLTATFAQIGPAAKNRVSHRGHALEAFRRELARWEQGS